MQGRYYCFHSTEAAVEGRRGSDSSRSPCKSLVEQETMQTSKCHIVKFHFPYTLLSYFTLNKKARKFALNAAQDLTALWDFIFSFLCKLLQLGIYPVIFSKERITIVFLGLYFFPKISKLLFPKFLPWSSECIKQKCMRERERVRESVSHWSHEAKDTS